MPILQKIQPLRKEVVLEGKEPQDWQEEEKFK
jgi:hypothetical protein